MTGQQWRTYALLLHFYVTYKAAGWLVGRYGSPWGYIIAMFLVATCLVGLIVPVIQGRVAKHRRDEVAA